MKSNKLVAITLVVGLWGGVASAQLSTNSYTFGASQTVPDGNPVGLAFTTNVIGLAGSISDITLSLNVAGGFNGDLYAYLAGPNGQLAVLLNRVGVSGSSAFGYSDTGLNITFSDSAPNGNIHTYQTVGGYAGLLSGGTWAPDGRNIDPLSAGSVFTGAATTSDFSLFNAADPNGYWTLFIADLSGGGTAIFNTATLNIITVPEPSSIALIGAAVAGLLAFRRRSSV